MEEFNWKKAKYPCFGLKFNGKTLACFSDYKQGHIVSDTENGYKKGYYREDFIMKNFKPYNLSKKQEKSKLWFWEHKKKNGNWYINTQRFSEKTRDMLSDKTYRKIEALGFIYE